MTEPLRQRGRTVGYRLKISKRKPRLRFYTQVELTYTDHACTIRCILICLTCVLYKHIKANNARRLASFNLPGPSPGKPFVLSIQRCTNLLVFAVILLSPHGCQSTWPPYRVDNISICLGNIYLLPYSQCFSFCLQATRTTFATPY